MIGAVYKWYYTHPEHLRTGLKKFGQDGQDATIKGLKQTLFREIFEEIDYNSFTKKELKDALPVLLFLSLKRDNSVKGRACLDDRKQRLWMQKEDTASPTIAVEALFYTFVMDALEESDGATCKLPGNFLQTEMEGKVIIWINGALALLLVKIDPERWVVYIKCSKAIYSTLNAAILSYEKLVGHLGDWGFEINPYEPCCWNQYTDNNQFTIVFHVNDMKLNHIDKQFVTNTIQKLESVYARLDPMTMTREKLHQYLGMTIDYRSKGEVRITMYNFIKKMIDELQQDMIGTKWAYSCPWIFILTKAKSENSTISLPRPSI